jgi:hypothetical protein
MSEAWIVDGIEDGWVRVETPTGGFLELPHAWLPARVAEGSVLRVDVSGGEGLERSVRFTIDEAASQRRRAALGEWREQLKRGPTGDLDL